MDDLKLHHGIHRCDIIDCDLCVTSYRSAASRYFEKFSCFPTSMLCSPVLVETAYAVVQQSAVKMSVVPVPGLQYDIWMLVGPLGIFYSPGA